MSRRHGLIGASKPYLYKEEDAEFYYRQTSGGVIMNNSPLVGSIDRIKGQTIAWNQLAKTGTSQSPYEHNGLSLTRLSNNTIRIQGTYTGTGTDMQLYPSLPLVKVVSGHKYYISGGSNNFAFSTYNNLPAYQNAPVVRGIYTATGTGNATIYIRCRNLVQNTAYDATFVCNLIDLTLIYGAGNEPSTPAQFEADYQKWFGKPLTYEPYDEGSLRNVQMEGIKSVGFNQWDEEWESGQYDPNTGESHVNNYNIRCKNLIPVIGGSSYYGKVPSQLRICTYDSEKNFLRIIYGGWRNDIKTFDNNVAYISICTLSGTYSSPITTYNNDICINISDTNKNGTYEPYKSETRNFDVTTITGKLNGEGESVVIFPDGMKGVNDVKDEIYIEAGVTKAVKRIGRVDLGSLSPDYINGLFALSPPNIKPATNYSSRKTGFLSSKYVPDSQVAISSTVMTDKTALKNESRLFIKDTSYTDAASFKTAMSGVMLDYELAEPQVYVLDTPLPIVYNCEAGGTEQILSEEIGTGIAPIMDITYNIGQINN